MKFVVSLLLTFASATVAANGFTNAAVPTRIDLVQAGTAGFMLFGEFGNVGGCSVSNQVFVEATHPQYDQMYATVLAAFMAGKAVALYAHSCQPVLWYSAANVTYNTVGSGGSIRIAN